MFIGHGFPVAQTITATRGDKISLEISPVIVSDDEETKQTIHHFRVSDQDMKLLGKNTGTYPCLAMQSRGAAVRLLGGTLVKRNGHDDSEDTVSE